ncbi:hypothetical protein HAX54_036761 [Datura stramonium]|uniref:Uncharacterized protein n=1 Tax=Datura stramonium TaxID=4076 RepID=A0ABS8VKM8_DATST|nr:hypothetical protein [Datura stramonium]
MVRQIFETANGHPLKNLKILLWCDKSLQRHFLLLQQSSQYAFMPANFAKLVRKVDRNVKQMKLFVEQLGTFVDRAIEVALASCVSLHAHIDDMEARVNERLKDLTVPDLAKFVAKLKKPKAARKFPREGDEDEVKSQKKKHRKRKQERVDFLEDQRLSRPEEDMRLKEMRAYVGGASSSLTPRSIEQMMSFATSLESQTLLTPSTTTEAVQADTLSGTVTTSVTIDVYGFTTPRTVVLDSQV